MKEHELIKNINGKLIEIDSKINKDTFHISGGEGNIGQQNYNYNIFNLTEIENKKIVLTINTNELKKCNNSFFINLQNCHEEHFTSIYSLDELKLLENEFYFDLLTSSPGVDSLLQDILNISNRILLKDDIKLNITTERLEHLKLNYQESINIKDKIRINNLIADEMEKIEHIEILFKLILDNTINILERKNLILILNLMTRFLFKVDVPNNSNPYYRSPLYEIEEDENLYITVATDEYLEILKNTIKRVGETKKKYIDNPTKLLILNKDDKAFIRAFTFIKPDDSDFNKFRNCLPFLSAFFYSLINYEYGTGKSLSENSNIYYSTYNYKYEWSTEKWVTKYKEFQKKYLNESDYNDISFDEYMDEIFPELI